MDSNLENLVKLYIDSLFKEFNKKPELNSGFINKKEEISLEIFKILSSREFTYFTRIKSEPYKIYICDKIQKLYNENKPLLFYFNLGGGYHARVDGDLSFEPGLSELLAIFQIKKFIDKISNLYPFNIIFKIIIDNRCAEFANGISIENTTLYAKKLSDILTKIGLDKKIKVILESDLITKENFNEQITYLEKNFVCEISEKDSQNAHRFHKDECISNKSVCARKYKIINKISKEVSSKYTMDGIRLVQRAVDMSFPFRSFPGGDSKIQCGKVVLLIENNSIKKPLLITMNNIKDFNLTKITLPENFVIPDILIATLRN